MLSLKSSVAYLSYEGKVITINGISLYSFGLKNKTDVLSQEWQVLVEVIVDGLQNIWEQGEILRNEQF